MLGARPPTGIATALIAIIATDACEAVRFLTAVAGVRYNDYNSMIPQQEMQPPDMGMAPGAPARAAVNS